MNEKELKKLIEDLKSSNLKINIIEKIKPSAKSLREELNKISSDFSSQVHTYASQQ